MRTRLLVAIMLTVLPYSALAQGQDKFSGDPLKFREELTTFMGPNLTPDQKLVFEGFIAGWDSLGFSDELKTGIILIANKMSGRNMRPAPEFLKLFQTIKLFRSSDSGMSYFNDWLKSFTRTITDFENSNTEVIRYLDMSGLLVSENTLYKSNSVHWKVGKGNLAFSYDTIFRLKLENADLICYSQRDSTIVHDVSGIYYPELLRFNGKNGSVTWEKAGYTPDEINCKIYDYSIDVTRNIIIADSAMLFHYIYFPEPVSGRLTDQAFNSSTPGSSIFPKFETRTTEFILENIYKDVNYKGGLALEGATVKGTGKPYAPATISLLRNDTLSIEIRSMSFILTKENVNTQEANMTLFIEDDSVFHSNLGFSYNVGTREVNFFRTSSPVSRSPYSNTFHDLDMYFEYLSWDMDEPLIKLSRARGAGIGQASFESSSFFKGAIFEKMMMFDEIHPLYMLKNFANYYYSETFPVEEYAKWLKRPPESVTALCIDLANKGFLFYDRSSNLVTIKPKVQDYIESFSKKKDYDVLSIFSEVNSPMDNAVIDLNTNDLTIYGVPNVFLSDSQRVAIFPYENKVVVERNRNMRFNGVVAAGLFTIFGHEFSFSYDTFKIHLGRIDSIQIAVETDRTDNLGRPLIEDINNLIQLGTAELFIDAPNNKSGRVSLEQYPIINALTDTYIFFDRIPNYEGIYKKEDFYFRVDPFSYDNIDHYKAEDLNLTGEFYGGKIINPIPQKLIIQDDNSLGFSLNIPPSGIEVYDGKGLLFDFLSMSNSGLIGSGSIQRLSGTTVSDKFMFFPDSMITVASDFTITASDDGKFPDLKIKEADIKWIPETDEYFAYNKPDKDFDIYSNGTKLDGFINQTPAGMTGSGVINRSDSRLNSDKFTFTANTITADSSDYSLKSFNGEGIAFLAENAVTAIDFQNQETRFQLNTGSSLVKFPEIQFICTMTNFVYDMESQILNMEQKGLPSYELTTAQDLIKIDLGTLESPTFVSTNNLKDTLKFASTKGFYSLREEFVQAEGTNYIPVADALIQPGDGKVRINKRGVIAPINNALVAINNKHLIHSASIQIISGINFTGTGVINYTDDSGSFSPITLSEIKVDTLVTNATGYISKDQNFKLSPFFTFIGDVNLLGKKDYLTFTGGAGIVDNCNRIVSEPVKFKAEINPMAVMIPLNDKPRDVNDNMVFSGSFINIDSTHVYPAFLSPRKSWSDIPMVTTEGFLYYDKPSGNYKIASLEKLTNNALPGNMVSLDKNFCVLTSEGNISFGTNYGLLGMTNAGTVIHNTDSSRLTSKAFLALDFYFSKEALRIMADELRLNPSARPVNLNTDFYRNGMNSILGESASKAISEEIGLFGTIRSLPPEFKFELLLNEVSFVWNDATSSFRSTGKIGIGFVGEQPVNVYVDGFIEIQRRRTGDLIDIYLKADESTWYYFSYFQGLLMTLSGNNAYNTTISEVKEKDRKDPKSTTRQTFTYMLSIEERYRNFIRRMSSAGPDIFPENE